MKHPAQKVISRDEPQAVIPAGLWRESRGKNLVGFRRQRGAALLIMAMIFIITVGLLVIGNRSRNAEKFQRDAEVNKLLADAKEAMIAIAVSNNTSPGMLVYPDRGDDPQLFDGRDDCHGPSDPRSAPNLLLGRLPFLGSGGGGCTLITTSLDVGQSLNPNEDSRPLHYAVSQNLVEYTGNTINSNVLDSTLVPDGWLTVYDENGNVLSAQVAFIIFYPGAALTGQDRSFPAADAAQFLDSFNVPGIGIINNSDPTTSAYVAATESSTFNDKLVFVTANDLILRVEQNMLNQIANNLSTTYAVPSSPFPATMPTGSPYNTQPFSNWLSTPNTYNTYGPSINYIQAGTCNGVSHGAVVTGVTLPGFLQPQCAGAD